MKTLVYLATPYFHSDPSVMEQRYIDGAMVAAKLIQQGFDVFNPIANNHEAATRSGSPLGWDYWSEFDRRMIALCDVLVVAKLPGWARSVGIAAERRFADDLGKPVFMVDGAGEWEDPPPPVTRPYCPISEK